MPSTRREVLYQIALAPLAAQQHPVHKAAPPPRPAARKTFNEHEFKSLQNLSNWIIPPDERSKGGIEAGAAEFIDLMAGEDEKLRAAFTGGIAWLDHEMRTRHGNTFLDCTPAEQKKMLDLIAWRDKAPKDLAPGVAFFALMRGWTVDAFYSSKAGVDDLGYVGNTAVAEFNGCPEEVVKKLLEKSPA